VAAEYEDYDEEEAPEPQKAKRPRKPVDWPLVIMLVGSAVFILVFFVITVMAPRRPFLLVRSGQQVRPAATAGASAPVTPVATPAVAAGATAPAKQ
jgi:hypothetical protein